MTVCHARRFARRFVVDVRSRAADRDGGIFARVRRGEVPHAPAVVRAGVRARIRARRLVGRERVAHERREPLVVGHRRAHALHVRERVGHGQAVVARIDHLAEARQQHRRDAALVSGGDGRWRVGDGVSSRRAGGDAPRLGVGVHARDRRPVAPPGGIAEKRDERRAKRDCVGRASRSVFHAPRVRGVEARPPVPAVRVPGPARRPKAHLPERIRHRARDAAPRPTAGQARHLERLRDRPRHTTFCDLEESRETFLQVVFFRTGL